MPDLKEKSQAIVFATPTQEDLPRVGRLLLKFYEEAQGEQAWFTCSEKFLGVLASWVENPLYFVEVAKQEGQVVGVIGGEIAQRPYHPDLMDVHELFWYVERSYRKLGVGLRLLEDFEEWGRRKGADLIFMQSLPHLDRQVEVLYQERGYRPIELVWVRKVR